MLLSSCDKRLEHPELNDPIYQALQNDQKTAEAAVAAKIKELEDSTKQYEATAAMDKMRIQLRRELVQHKQTLKRLEELALYKSLQVEKRAAEARIEYDKAYRAKEEWPRPSDFKRYQANERLKHSSRSWSSRVPKPGAKPPAPKPAEPAPAAH